MTPARHRTTKVQRERIARLYSAGMEVSEIADLMGMRLTTVMYIARKVVIHAAPIDHYGDRLCDLV